jgi:hypothetical protein
VRQGRLIVSDTTTTSEPLLDDAVSVLAAKQGKNPKAVVRALSKGLRSRLTAWLVEQGTLREQRGRILGLVSASRWPSSDSAHEDSMRALLVDALRTGSTDDAHIAALVSLLHALKAVTKVVDPAQLGMTKKELNAKRIADGDWASEAVRGTSSSCRAASSSRAAAPHGRSWRRSGSRRRVRRRTA